MRRNQGRPDKRVRAVFLSDVHIGSKHSQCDALLDFLEDLTPQRLYIVGDLIDGWQLKRSFHWLPAYSRLLDLLAGLADRGTRLFYLPGNHDSFVSDEDLMGAIVRRLGFVEIAEQLVFEAADRRRFLVLHGDRFDVVEQSAQWLSLGVTGIYDAALSANWCLSRFRGESDCSPYRLCAAVKDRVKTVIRFISRFEDSLLAHARSHGCHGVICGHLHTPAIVHRNGMTYCNTGDWVENCTALLEYEDGSLELEFYYPQVPARPTPSGSVRLPIPANVEYAWNMKSPTSATACAVAVCGTST